MDRFGIQEPEHVLNLGVDETAKSYMLETARWGKFLAILGFIGIGLLIIMGAALAFVVATTSGTANAAEVGTNAGLMIFYIILGLLYLYPIIGLYRFSKNIKTAVETFNRESFNAAFRHLRNIFKFLGIVTIISLGLSGVMLALGFFAALMNA